MSEEEIKEKIKWAFQVNDNTKELNENYIFIERQVIQELLKLNNKEKRLNQKLKEQLLSVAEMENRGVNKYWIDKIKDKIKELKKQLERTNTMEWQEIIKKQIEALEDLLKE